MPDKFSKYQTLFQKMPVPRFVVEAGKGQDYTVREVNEMASRYFALPASQIIARRLSDFMDHDNMRHFQQSFEVCVSKKQSVSIQALPGVPTGMKVYGFYISPVIDENGAVSFIDIIGQIDTADQSILQRERDDAVSLLTSIFEVSEIGIIVTDSTNKIIRVNDSFTRTYGWSRDELLGQEVIGLVTPDERATARGYQEEFERNDKRGAGELKLIRKDGSIANALFTIAPLELSQKRRFQVMTVMDITLRKQMEESLRLAKDQADGASRAKSTFLANMSHELRTPLNASLGFSEMMIKETFGALGHAKYKEYLEDVHASAKHLLEIINEVLDMSKIEAGRIELDEHEVDVGELILSVTRMMASRAFGSNLKLHTDFTKDLPHLYADQRLVRQILINLVANAVKFSKAGGNINVGAVALDDGCLQMRVADEGIGIPRHKIKQAMEPFGQIVEHAENSRQQGTGLGLPLAKAMAELHEGTLTLESNIRKGTLVLVTFPLYRSIKIRPSAPVSGGESKLADPR
ncbi:MAG: PAS domain-containing sensor histidine kinase [Alphaproteobacteria bacterium]